MKNWKKRSKAEIKEMVFSALDENVNFIESNVIGIPGSRLDPKVFYQDAPFLAEAPFLSALIRNPNHIGCHSLGDSEPFFAGTQKIELETLRMCAEDILRAEPNSTDGYVASGGTEANIQAAWIYRNYFMQEKGADTKEIALICSADNHYSAAKAANLLNIDFVRIAVDDNTRKVQSSDLKKKITQLKAGGVKHIIVFANMMTTMFGSVDHPDDYVPVLKEAGMSYFIHVDGAYGGFVYPFNGIEHGLDFSHPGINSITLDAHKMVQAPYGTGVFLIRKGYMHYVRSDEASYVKGLDATLIGSRSGANAVAIWMILSTYGKSGWTEKIQTLIARAKRIADVLTEKGIAFYREKGSNIVAIRSGQIPIEVIEGFHLVPDDHHNPRWNKIVVMEHVTDEKVDAFLTAINRQHYN
ncbi:MAG: aspartate aminotransferase family protein [Cryomorphaceae bacterium]|nr:aspartate aminotransferase family protein [Cryomorphaceae bacterium]